MHYNRLVSPSVSGQLGQIKNVCVKGNIRVLEKLIKIGRGSLFFFFYFFFFFSLHFYKESL